MAVPSVGLSALLALVIATSAQAGAGETADLALLPLVTKNNPNPELLSAFAALLDATTTRLTTKRVLTLAELTARLGTDPGAAVRVCKELGCVVALGQMSNAKLVLYGRAEPLRQGITIKAIIANTSTRLAERRISIDVPTAADLESAIATLFAEIGGQLAPTPSRVTKVPLPTPAMLASLASPAAVPVGPLAGGLRPNVFRSRFAAYAGLGLVGSGTVLLALGGIVSYRSGVHRADDLLLAGCGSLLLGGLFGLVHWLTPTEYSYDPLPPPLPPDDELFQDGGP